MYARRTFEIDCETRRLLLLLLGCYGRVSDRLLRLLLHPDCLKGGCRCFAVVDAKVTMVVDAHYNRCQAYCSLVGIRATSGRRRRLLLLSLQLNLHFWAFAAIISNTLAASSGTSSGVK